MARQFHFGVDPCSVRSPMIKGKGRVKQPSQTPRVRNGQEIPIARAVWGMGCLMGEDDAPRSMPVNTDSSAVFGGRWSLARGLPELGGKRLPLQGPNFGNYVFGDVPDDQKQIGEVQQPSQTHPASAQHPGNTRGELRLGHGLWG